MDLICFQPVVHFQSKSIDHMMFLLMKMNLLFRIIVRYPQWLIFPVMHHTQSVILQNQHDHDVMHRVKLVEDHFSMKFRIF